MGGKMRDCKLGVVRRNEGKRKLRIRGEIREIN